jgi:hypothetical protein
MRLNEVCGIHMRHRPEADDEEAIALLLAVIEQERYCEAHGTSHRAPFTRLPRLSAAAPPRRLR